MSRTTLSGYMLVIKESGLVQEMKHYDILLVSMSKIPFHKSGHYSVIEDATCDSWVCSQKLQEIATASNLIIVLSRIQHMIAVWY